MIALVLRFQSSLTMLTMQGNMPKSVRHIVCFPCFLVSIVVVVALNSLVAGADPGFFLGGGALVSCSTSTPINHVVFFFFAEYQLY